MRITTVMFSCLLACASTLVLAESNTEYFLDQFAPSEQEQAGWQQAQDVYRKFAATPEFVGGEITKQQLQVRADLENACMITFKDCQTFLKLNRNKILHALPNNPMYWRRFWEILEVNVHTFSDSNDFPDYQPLIPATMYWFYRDLLLDGELDGDKALALQKGLNLWLTSHGNLLGRMMTIAMRGIALQQMNYAMAQASRSRDEKLLAALIQANQPLSPSEISYGPTIWMEREPNIAAFESLKTEPAWLEADWQALGLNPPPDMDPAVLMRFSEDPTSLYLRDTDILAKHYVPESIKPWDLYWSEGVDEINEADYEVGFLSALIGPAYAAYIATTRYSVFYAHVFDALADIYTGRASPGLPGRPAPTHWRWDWQEGPYPKVVWSTTQRTRARKKALRDPSRCAWSTTMKKPWKCSSTSRSYIPLTSFYLTNTPDCHSSAIRKEEYATMSQCPFHAGSTGSSDRGEIESIDCPICGSYRISKTALESLQGTSAPKNWSSLVSHRPVISTRDTRTATA